MTAHDYDLQEIRDLDLPELRKLWSAYLLELAIYSDEVEPGMELQEDWWTRPDDLHGLIVLASGSPVGFVFIMGARYTEAIGESTEFHLHEMYVAPEHRGTGLALWAVHKAFELHAGTWSLHAFTKNERAVRFWRALLAEPSYKVIEGDFDENTLSFHFEVAHISGEST